MSTRAEISGGDILRPSASTQASSLLSALTIRYGTISMSRCTTSSVIRRPMSRFTANRVLLGFVTAWRFADWPTSTSESEPNATMEGVVRSPSLFSMTRGLVPSMTATHEFVVPRSIPMVLAMAGCSANAMNGRERQYAAWPVEFNRNDAGRPAARIRPRPARVGPAAPGGRAARACSPQRTASTSTAASRRSNWRSLIRQLRPRRHVPRTLSDYASLIRPAAFAALGPNFRCPDLVSDFLQCS